MYKFWDMFVIDALIGNGDRHLDNWGILSKSGQITFAPIYDCGSSLGALLSDEQMKNNLDDYTTFKNEEYNKKSCYTLDGKRIIYPEIFKAPPTELNAAVVRMVPGIDMHRIQQIIVDMECVS